jgi:ABC-type polysaccharide/polyol phosphate transport system ATPase subunit
MHAVEVSHLTKEYRLGAMQSLRQTAAHAGARLLGRQVAEKPMFKALDDVSFTVQPGEVVGIIGHNGAGKSTLLKMLSRISTPTSGSVKVHGRVAPLIEVGAGFVGDFTGRENVYLNGAILGMSKSEIARKFDEIVDFAEMAQFIDTPVKRYSSGMQVKLAFAVATSIESEILIVDEVLAVGDLAFQRKCFDRMEELIKRQRRTVLLVSHNIRQVERLCSRVLVLDHGRVAMDGPARESCNFFFTQSDDRIRVGKTSSVPSNDRKRSTGEIELLSLKICNVDGEPATHVMAGAPVRFLMRYMVRQTIVKPIFGFGFHTTDFIYLGTTQSVDKLRLESLQPGEYEISFSLCSVPFVAGVYSLRVGVALGDYFHPLFYAEDLAQISVVQPGANMATVAESGEGFVRLDGDWAATRLGTTQDLGSIVSV